MALAGWNENQKIKLIIDNSVIDEDLTNFTSLIHLSDSCGKNSFNGGTVISGLMEEAAFTYNPNDKHSYITLSNGNLTAEKSTTTGWVSVRATNSFNSGKIYIEFEQTVAHYAFYGVMTAAGSLSNYLAASVEGWGYYCYNGTKVYNITQTAYGASALTTGDVIGMAINFSTGKIWWSKNGVWQASGDPASDINEAFSNLTGKTLFPAASHYYTGGYKGTIRTTTAEFSYTPPIGFVPAGLADYPLKLAIENGDTGIQCYTEITYWNSAEIKAIMNTRVPNITAGTTTILHLYYDKTHADNTTYVGLVTSSPGKNAYDTAHERVYNLTQIPVVATASILDSTVNTNHATPTGMNSNNLIDTAFGKGLSFDGSTSFLTMPTTSLTNYSIEMRLKPKTIFTGDGAVVFDNEGIVFSNDYTACLAAGDVELKGTTIIGDTYINLAVTKSGSAYSFYENGVSVGTSLVDTGWGLSGVYKVGSGKSSQLCEMDVDFLKISSVTRSAAWIKANHHSVTDNLISFVPTISGAVYTFNGFVQTEGTPVGGRPVYIYNRDTGKLVYSTVSASGTGYFEFLTTTSGVTYFATILPELGQGYNILAYDNINLG